MNNKQQKDIEMGNYYERKVLKWFNDNDYSQNKLSFYSNPFNVMDMVSEDRKNILELKSRRIIHNRYPDIMIGLNKVEEAIKHCKNFDYYLLFLFEDGLYKWKYAKGKKYDIRMGGRMDRGKDERKMCAYIPTKDLVCVTTEINSIS